MEEAKILIVDDEPRSLYAMEMLLYREPYRIILADGGEAAIEQVKRELPDVILLDVMMPDITGYDVCRRLKDDDRLRHIPIVLVTALQRKEDVVRGLDAGADEFLTKPVNGPELRARVRSMLRIKKQYDEIQETLQLREELANMIVHDMRTPLSTIALYSDILITKTGKEANGDYLRLAETIRSQSHRLNAFLSDMLVLAKMRAGKLMLNRKLADPYHLVNSAVEAYQPHADSKRMTLVRDMQTDGLLMRLDGKLMQRMIDNLLSNAIKFSPPDTTVTVRLRAVSTDTGAEPVLRLQVIDEGPGVPTVYHERIFSKYETVHSDQTDVQQVGLGLALCRMVAESHGGRIYVENNVPTGAIFTVEI
jgi:signal transduction histidine kinase